MNLAARQFMEVDLGPFGSAAEACDYCFSSFTKTGQPPAGPVAPFCVCMAYPEGGKYNMFCATPPSAAGYIADKKGAGASPATWRPWAPRPARPSSEGRRRGAVA